MCLANGMQQSSKQLTSFCNVGRQLVWRVWILRSKEM